MPHYPPLGLCSEPQAGRTLTAAPPRSPLPGTQDVLSIGDLESRICDRNGFNPTDSRHDLRTVLETMRQAIEKCARGRNSLRVGAAAPSSSRTAQVFPLGFRCMHLCFCWPGLWNRAVLFNLRLGISGVYHATLPPKIVSVFWPVGWPSIGQGQQQQQQSKTNLRCFKPSCIDQTFKVARQEALTWASPFPRLPRSANG